MILFFIALLAVSIWQVKFASFHEGYIDREQTGSMKGLFAVIIVFSHSLGYVTLSSGVIDSSFRFVISSIGQLMVALFFFYSGYGIISSYAKKNGYSKTFLQKRVAKVLVEFDVAVLLYLVLSFILGHYYHWSNYVFCWIGWKGVGNSNWFVFVVLLLYLLTFLSFQLSELVEENNKSLVLTVVVTILSLLVIVCLRFIAEGSWWYDTILCYPFGMWFAISKEKFEALIKKSKLMHWIVLIASALIFVALYLLARVFNPISFTYNLCACAFCLFITVVSTKVRINNKILRWLGVHSFAIYILQRIPMMILSKFGVVNPYVFEISAIALTMVISYAFVKAFATARKKINNSLAEKRGDNDKTNCKENI